MTLYPFHNKFGECGSCTVCAKIHTKDELNTEIDESPTPFGLPEFVELRKKLETIYKFSLDKVPETE